MRVCVRGREGGRERGRENEGEGVGETKGGRGGRGREAHTTTHTPPTHASTLPLSRMHPCLLAIKSHPCSQARRYAHAHTQTQARTHRCTDARTQPRALTPGGTRTRPLHAVVDWSKHTHTHTHTRTHTHTQVPWSVHHTAHSRPVRCLCVRARL